MRDLSASLPVYVKFGKLTCWCHTSNCAASLLICASEFQYVCCLHWNALWALIKEETEGHRALRLTAGIRHSWRQLADRRRFCAICPRWLLRPDTVVTALLSIVHVVAVAAIPVSLLLYLYNLHVTSKHLESLILKTKQSDVLDFSHLQRIFKF